VVMKSCKELRESLVAVAPIFAEKPFFMSEEFSLVDCCVAPILWRLPSLGVDSASSLNPCLTIWTDYLIERLSRRACRCRSGSCAPREARVFEFQPALYHSCHLRVDCR
jgi:glutathione S-transferase